MADSTIEGLDTLASPDRTADKLAIWDADQATTKEATINAALGISGGDPVSTSDTQTLSNKTLGNTTTLTVKDANLTIQDDADTTKQAKFQASGITTGTTRTYTLPDATTTLVGTDTTQTLTNKTLTSPTINTATISNPTLTTDTVSEYTAANGVTVDGLNIKDSKLNTNDSVVTANITNSAVTTAKVNDDAITDAKLIYGKVRSRQGGSATDWNSTGTTTYDYSGTNVFVQVGAVAVSANPTTVTFPTAFSQVPAVIATMSTATSSNAWVICTAKTATTASFRCINDAGTVVTTESINWIAVGQ